MDTRRRSLIAALGTFPIAFLPGCDVGKDAATHLRYWGTGTLDIGTKNWGIAEEQIGVTVSFTDNGNDLGPVVARMLSGTAARDFDIGGVQGGAEPELFRGGAILPWDVRRLKNWNNIWNSLREEVPYLKVSGQQVGIPLIVNADSMIYREKATGVVDSYAAIFDPQFKGRTSMEDSWMNSVIFTAIFMKENNIDGMGTIRDPGNLTEDELYTVMEFLKKHKQDGQFYKFWNGWEEGVRFITSGDVDVMTGWEPIFIEAQKRGISDARYAEPVEGYEGWSNNVILHSGVRTSEGRERDAESAAYKFVDWLLGGVYGCILGQMRGYMVPTPNCVQYLQEFGPLKYSSESGVKLVESTDAAELSDHVRTKLERHKGGVYWQNARPDNYTLYERLWAELRIM